MQLQCIAEFAHREAVVTDVQIQARWILRGALETMPSIDSLNALATSLGTHQDAKLLRDVVRRETHVPNYDVLLEALQASLPKRGGRPRQRTAAKSVMIDAWRVCNQQ